MKVFQWECRFCGGTCEAELTGNSVNMAMMQAKGKDVRCDRCRTMTDANVNDSLTNAQPELGIKLKPCGHIVQTGKIPANCPECGFIVREVVPFGVYPTTGTYSAVCKDSNPGNANCRLCGHPSQRVFNWGYDAAVREIVAWLRTYPQTCPCKEEGEDPCRFSSTMDIDELADAIERGEYRT